MSRGRTKKRQEKEYAVKAGQDGCKARERETQDAKRHLCSVLRFWTVCAGKTCNRAKACCGDANACHARWWPHVPDELKFRLQKAIEASAAGLPPQEAVRFADEQAARYAALMAQPERRGAHTHSAPARNAALPVTRTGERMPARARWL